jgi:predicted hotdog family 3-hydroxylacyl-ACP dehydratase
MPINAAELLPHAAPMVLLDHILYVDAQRLIGQTLMQPSFPFYSEHGIAIHIGVEIMAQACGAFVGWHDRQKGGTIRAGLLLSVRNFVAHCAHLPAAGLIESTVESILFGEELGVFQCTLSCVGQQMAQAQLSLMRPNSTEAFIALLAGKHE